MISVLVVEDNEDKRDLVFASLKAAQVDVEAVKTAETVVGAIKLLGAYKFDILILDLKLPRRNTKQQPTHDAGISILRHLQRGDLYVPSTVFGLTSFSELKEEYIEEFRSLDFHLHETTNSDTWMNALQKKIHWLSNSKMACNVTQNKKVLITVHGVNTAGTWQENLDKLCRENEEIVNKSYKYVHKSFIKIVFPRWRNKFVEKFKRDIQLLFREHPDCDFYFFAHSFGTFIVAEALRSSSFVNTPNIKMVVLAGSVLKRDYQWDQIRRDHNIQQIINDCGTRDLALPAAHLFGKGLGMAGRSGFYSFRDDKVLNRYFDGGHSFFEKTKNFYEEFWLPLIKDPPEINTTNTSPNELKEKLLDLSRPILYFGLVLLFLFFLIF